MEDWLDGAAAALGEVSLDPDEVLMVLRLARDVAHGVDRRMAPLVSYLAGVAAGRASEASAAEGGGAGGPTDRLAALRRVIATLGPSVPREDDGTLRPDDPERGPGGPTDG